MIDEPYQVTLRPGEPAYLDQGVIGAEARLDAG